MNGGALRPPRDAHAAGNNTGEAGQREHKEGVGIPGEIPEMRHRGKAEGPGGSTRETRGRAAGLGIRERIT